MIGKYSLVLMSSLVDIIILSVGADAGSGSIRSVSMKNLGVLLELLRVLVRRMRKGYIGSPPRSLVVSLRLIRILEGIR